jgi:hypothetical protein
MEARGIVTADGRDWPALIALVQTLAPDYAS